MKKKSIFKPSKLKSKVPQLSDEAKEINKFNLFSLRNNKVKHNI